ncbi:hypothetical protein CIPAW_03G261900 [Carya illinoinensis]|uniref:Uncharacterized protein n=1 Tax=Carya illinoinensis TaxID=32201 RepID=A0A8T1R9D9_CARIL|nr:hypothetical protein CIPAW_03G261900 [Carya illinoinensis]
MFLVLLKMMVLLLTTLDSSVPPVMAANQVNHKVHISGSTISGRKLIFAAGAQNAAPLLQSSMEKGYVPPSAPDRRIPFGSETNGSEHAIASDTSVNSLKTAPNGVPPTSPTLAPASTNNQRIKRDVPAGKVVASTPSTAYP